MAGKKSSNPPAQPGIVNQTQGGTVGGPDTTSVVDNMKYNAKTGSHNSPTGVDPLVAGQPAGTENNYTGTAHNPFAASDASANLHQQWLNGQNEAQASGDGGGVYVNAANAQAQASQNSVNQQTQANRPNVNGPFGSQSWSKDANGNWTMNNSFNGPLSGAANSLQSQYANNVSQPFDNGSAARDQAINAAYGQSKSRLDPQWAQRTEQTGADLANSGLDPNSQAYRTAMQQQGQQRNDAYGSAMNSAIAQGTAAQQATFQQNMAARDMPLQELQQMQGFTNTPGFNAAGAWQPPNLLGAQTGQDQKDIGQQQIYADWAKAGAQVVGAGADYAKSDARVKQDIQRLPMDAIPGVPLAAFSYKSHPSQRFLGVIAQDLEKVAPEHVATGPDGIKRVSAPFAPFSFKGGK